MPFREDSGMAFVLVQHLDPDHESLLPEILQKGTEIPVLEVSEKCNFKPNHIYVMPSNKMMETSEGKLQLAPRPEKKKFERILPLTCCFQRWLKFMNRMPLGWYCRVRHRMAPKA
jgi:two-component system, chemotaxis family, CheB/CheR fusion protein